MALVSDLDREQVTSARLAALETDGGLQDNFGADSDAEFQLEDSDQGGPPASAYTARIAGSAILMAVSHMAFPAVTRLLSAFECRSWVAASPAHRALHATDDDEGVSGVRVMTGQSLPLPASHSWSHPGAPHPSAASQPDHHTKAACPHWPDHAMPGPTLPGPQQCCPTPPHKADKL